MQICKLCGETVLYAQPHEDLDGHRNYVHANCYTEYQRRLFEGNCTVCNTDEELTRQDGWDIPNICVPCWETEENDRKYAGYSMHK